ncbi:MAG: hypothetical protein JNG89_01790 [Planctomycetaceae bacterium]|nr:hypothetical protein [Planctomycetaceae bacterium]
MPAAPLDRDEYIEQAYFFRVCRERTAENSPAQEVLLGLKEEVLATTRLPLAIDFLLGELHHAGKMGPGMARLRHYFTSFQAFVVQRAEDEESRFDMRVAYEILEREAEYRASDAPTPQGLFVYQFECISRNRLGYDLGMQALADDPLYGPEWRDWILRIRRELGTVDFAELIYLRSQHRVDAVRRRTNNPDYQPSFSVLFGTQEGKIARANRGKDPLYMFAALQRHLDYPRVPRPRPARSGPLFDPQVEMRFQRLENRLGILEADGKSQGIDLSQFYTKPADDPGA